MFLVRLTPRLYGTLCFRQTLYLWMYFTPIRDFIDLKSLVEK